MKKSLSWIIITFIILTSGCANWNFLKKDSKSIPKEVTKPETPDKNEQAKQEQKNIELKKGEDAKAEELDKAKQDAAKEEAAKEEQKAEDFTTKALEKFDSKMDTKVPVPENGEKMQSISMEDAPLEQILDVIAQNTKMNYIMDPSVRGKKVTINIYQPVKPEALFSILEAILQMNGLAAIRSGDLWKIVPAPNAKEYPLETLVGKDAENISKADRLITQIIPLQYINAQDALGVISGFCSKNHGEYADPNTNILIITDYAANIYNVLKIISVLDVPKSSDQLKVFQLKFAEVQDLVNIINQFFSGRSSSKKYKSQSMGTRRGMNPDSQQPPGTSEPFGALTGGEAPIVIPDPRSNTIIVYGSKSAIDAIGEIIKLVDVDVFVPEKMYVYYVQNAKSEKIAATLNSVYGKSKDKKKSSTGFMGTRTGMDQQTNPLLPNQRNAGVEASEGEGVRGEVSIVSDEETNALIVFTDPQNWPHIEETIKMLDIMPKQVLIEALIAEISLTDQTQFGISWYLKSKDSINAFGEDFRLTENTALNLGKTSSPSGYSNAPLGLSFSFIDPQRLASLLTLYASGSRLNVLSSPHLLASDNQEARIDIGSQVPIVTSETLDNTTTTSRYNQVQYKDTGVILTVTPHVNNDRFVRLDISQEVSEATENTLGGTTSPIIQKRQVKTTVTVKDSETLIIGGMISKTKRKSDEGIPGLRKIPVLKYLFGNWSSTTQSTELLVMITPHVIGSEKEAKEVSEDFKAKVDSLLKEIQKARKDTGGVVSPDEKKEEKKLEKESQNTSENESTK
jgi:general secretion pathway protein D